MFMPRFFVTLFLVAFAPMACLASTRGLEGRRLTLSEIKTWFNPLIKSTANALKPGALDTRQLEDHLKTVWQIEDPKTITPAIIQPSFLKRIADSVAVGLRDIQNGFYAHFEATLLNKTSRQFYFIDHFLDEVRMEIARKVLAATPVHDDDIEDRQDRLWGLFREIKIAFKPFFSSLYPETSSHLFSTDSEESADEAASWRDDIASLEAWLAQRH